MICHHHRRHAEQEGLACFNNNGEARKVDSEGRKSIALHSQTVVAVRLSPFFLGHLQDSFPRGDRLRTTTMAIHFKRKLNHCETASYMS
jgi:hypothetical protein